MIRTERSPILELGVHRLRVLPPRSRLGRRGVPIVEVPISYTARAIADGAKVCGPTAMWVLVKHRLRR
ncbi:MAG: hypothetical protein R2939_18245 [Kofleriaceae bacterium]